MTSRASLSVIVVAAAIGLAGPAIAQSGFAPADKQKSQSPPTSKFAPPPAAKTAPKQAPPAPSAPAARKDAPRTQTAAAQSTGQPNALQGFSQNKGEPVKISSSTLEVRDKERVATFNGNVHLTQGDTVLTCASLVVHYEGEEAKSTMTTASSTPGGQQRIRRLEARGNVQVVQKDQTVNGEAGVFDMRTNTVTLTGNVVIAQGKNIMRGAQKLTVDLTNGVSRMEGGRVEGLFINDSAAPKAEPNAPADMLKLPRTPRNN